MPSAIVTKTTGETGRKVPVPRRWMQKPASRLATSDRCDSMAGSAASSTSVGGTSVMWVGIMLAVVSPTDVR